MNLPTLTPKLRFQYLNAMGITQWVPRADEENIAQSETEELPAQPEYHSTSAQQIMVETEEKAEQNEPTKDKPLAEKKTTPEALITELDQNKSTGDSEQPTSNTEPSANTELSADTEPSANTEHSANSEPQANLESTVTKAPTVNVKTSENAQEPTLPGYLNMINWQKGMEGGSKVLLICRHDKDQPAQSFARKNSPSEFMQDLIRAFEAILSTMNKETSFHLAHYTEAGLGENCQPMGQQLNSLKPDLIILLGEESVKQAFGDSVDVARLRGKKQLLGDQFNSIVTYHPFELINNPALKKLAMQDLLLGKSFLATLDTL